MVAKTRRTGAKRYAHGKWEKRKRPLKVSEYEFQVTGTHVIIVVATLLTAAYFAGLLPDP